MSCMPCYSLKIIMAKKKICRWCHPFWDYTQKKCRSCGRIFPKKKLQNKEINQEEN